MVDEVLIISNPMVCKSSLPDFPLAPEYRTESMRVSAFNELNGVLNGYIVRGCEQKMNVFWHEYKGVNLETTFTPVPIHSYKKGPRIIFDDEESAALPSRKGNEVSSGRRDESSRLQEQTSAAKAASFP
jgi:hypothetical protein